MTTTTTTTTSAPRQPWKTGLCDCTCAECDAIDFGCGFCTVASLFDQYGATYAKVIGGDPRDIADDFAWSHKFTLHNPVATENRKRLREKYNLEGNCCGAYCAYVLCTCCAVLQDTREVALREAEAASNGTAMRAPVHASMTHDRQDDPSREAPL